MNIIERKHKLRKILKDRLASITEEQRIFDSEVICNKVICDDNYINADKLFIYLSFGTEVKTNKLINHAINNNKQIYVPKIDGSIMNMVKLDKETNLVSNKFGIMEPDNNCKIYDGSVDLAIMPLLGFDNTCARLGRGGGYYDKFLQDKEIAKIGLAFSLQRLETVPREKHDKKLNMIITELEDVL